MKIILFAFLLVSGFSVWAVFMNSLFVIVILCMALLSLLSTLFFFRDPNRSIPEGENILVSPADGRVVCIEAVDDRFVGKGTRISIFMSIFDVHVTRVPFQGIIEKVEYIKGNFRAAFKASASLENERSIVSLKNGDLKITFTQIAGIIARRIASHLCVGDNVVRGERYGIIMFGSRMDIIVPENVRIDVNIGDKVRGGESIIGGIL